jgi:hypothetical protein
MEGSLMAGAGTPDCGRRRLLMCGEELLLLKIRALVLESAGFGVDLSDTVDGIRGLVALHRYALLVICHTIPDEQVQSFREIGAQAGVQTCVLERLLPPQTLISIMESLTEAGVSSSAVENDSRKLERPIEPL